MVKRRRKRQRSNKSEKAEAAMAEEKQSEACFPNDIIVDILSWIPVDDLIPLRLVSKQWSDLICDPFFINAHARRAKPKPGFIFQSEHKENTIIFIDMEKAEKKSFQFKPGSGSDDCLISIHGSCNGLILLETMEVVCIYNPILSRAFALPRLTHIADESTCLWNLAYDSTAKTCKVVCGRRGNEGYECNILTVGEKCESWRQVMIPAPHCLCVFPPVYANGSLHWMIHSKEIENLEGNWNQVPESEGHLLTLDVAGEVFYKTVHPRCDSGVYTLLEMDGALCFADHAGNSQLNIWVLKDLEKQEWEEVCSVDLAGEMSFKGFLVDAVPVLIVRDREFKIIIKCHDDFYCYDVEFKTLQDLKLNVEWKSGTPELEQRFSPFRHVNTLLSWDS